MTFIFSHEKPNGTAVFLDLILHLNGFRVRHPWIISS
jgi:hypothetical protein